MLSGNISIRKAGDLVGLAEGTEGKKVNCLQSMQKFAIFHTEIVKFGLILTHLKLFGRQKIFFLGGKTPTPPVVLPLLI